MLMEILITLVVWLTIGVVIGGWISVDTFRRNVKGTKWVALGVLLSVIGLVIYLMMREKNDLNRPKQHNGPEYRYIEPTAPERQAKPTTQTMVEPAPVMTHASPEPVHPSPEPTVPEVDPLPMPEGPRPEYRPQEPVNQEQVEGIPRCPKCGVAISSFDDFCSECGAKLK
jgi:hypothetical protein